MRFTYIKIENYKSIRMLEIKDIENAMILVGRNNTGKTSIIDALLLATGNKKPSIQEFLDDNKCIDITVTLEITEDDLNLLHSKRKVSHLNNYADWLDDFMDAFPSYHDDAITYTCHIDPSLNIKYRDSFVKNNTKIPEILPKIYHIDQTRELGPLERDIFGFYDKESYRLLKENECIFDSGKKCNQCFQCIGLINKKTPEELTLFETSRLMQYKLFSTNINKFADKVNFYLHENGNESQDIRYYLDLDTEQLIHIDTQVKNNNRDGEFRSIDYLSEGMKSIYALSVLEAYTEENDTLPCIIIMEDPEIYLHPHLQKVASEILYKLSKKNQVIFSTHSPNLIFNFSIRQIKEIVLDENYYTVTREDSDIDAILDDLGYTANDMMNVSFVFIVEGKQDKNRLPLLLKKYYNEIYDENGNLNRISIVPVNSCTNIKTYANLKYINQLYIKDQFLMIRDSDGKNPKYLVKQLCSYYGQRSKEDAGGLPEVKPKNVLILKYYSFENYFLDPKVMAKIGVIKNEDEFYTTLYHKYKDYLYKLPSFRRLCRTKGIRIRSKEDVKNNIEDIKIYVRGHNLFDIFYGKYHGGDAEQEILEKYVDTAPRDTFKDIFDKIDSFIYFESRKKKDV